MSEFWEHSNHHRVFVTIELIKQYMYGVVWLAMAWHLNILVKKIGKRNGRNSFKNIWVTR